MTETMKPAASSTSGAPRRIRVQVKQNVSLDNLQKIVAGIAGHTGCTACGLLGVDLQLVGDPVEYQQIAQLEGVAHVSSY